jgi:hypothetical protein
LTSRPETLGNFLKRVSAVALADLRLSRCDFLHDERVGSAGDDGHIEPLGGKKAPDLRLIESAVLGLGDPVELHGKFERRGFRVGRVEQGGHGEG